jgi:hypothetical protein
MNILDLPLDILYKFCGDSPILGLTCKKFNSLCPIKPYNTAYNQNETTIDYIIINGCVPYYYYINFDFRPLNSLITSQNVQDLNISEEIINNMWYYIKQILDNNNKNILLKNWEYKYIFMNIEKDHKNKLLFKQMTFEYSFIMSFIMTLYH